MGQPKRKNAVSTRSPEAIERSRQQAGNVISRQLWDFSLCRKEELSFCLFHEYIREVALVHRRRMGAKWSPASFYSLFEGYFKNGTRVQLGGVNAEHANDPFELNLAIKRRFACAVCSCTGFPDTPYLQVPAEERNSRLQDLGLANLRPDRAAMMQEGFFEICRDPKEGLMFYQDHLTEWVRQNLEHPQAVDTVKDPWIVDFDGFKFELGVIRINWSWSDNQLVVAFKRWLEQNRPSGIQSVETRGSTTIAEQLKYLSAKRLLAGMSASEAAKLTQKILGEPLYWEDTNWYSAKAKAQSIMKQLTIPFFTWADE